MKFVVKDNYSTITIGEGALDIGVYNGFVYLIKANGEVWVNRLACAAERLFSKLAKNEIQSPFTKKEFIKIASLGSFPLDSLAYRNKLLVFTEDGTFVLNLSMNPKKVNIVEHKDFKPFSALKKDGMLFFSFGEEGFSAIKPVYSNNELHHYEIASSKIIISGDVVVNLYPDASPKLFKILSPNHYAPSSSYPLFLNEDSGANQYFKNLEIESRDIIAPYATPEEIVLPTSDQDIVIRKVIADGHKESQFEILSDETPEQTDTLFRYLDYEQSFDTRKETAVYREQEKIEFPITRHFHPEGIVEVFWDKVEFMPFSGGRRLIVKHEEISEVRTYPDNVHSCSLIAIATEKACHLVDIPVINPRYPLRRR